ncbi:hypothetical protein GLOIN_2v1814843 [Rhizophagus irregularis DAOM 181602=DAOM 197198]|uniref:RING-type domain-containing protein n=1 Tax=Rhizophagus irregularis (strain DAOM 181602 / DAOM 197198 / MUCL 43194) TaxID=747089 RepID=A0A2P4QK14_RHIID|nr:hypothetical protein GLOIN_2v1814843 [Rhizophagus irregularis DAOM 181602=DAOM 197198]POG77971.1 hypothetical protein GLOIN_2v1814843 [Rhizophagus irregularis DAOM 181602=DAOM 197198]|eukprot:XP_025184837.1 hypothetical protein GLOIN_2v1814843 [Rhizophagus irregularis DAOM 181602=DAOM 197198]
MVQKNYGPCSVHNCNNQINRFRQFTQLACEKAQKKGTYELYAYLRIGQQLCHTHYMSIVECDRNQKPKTLLPMEIDNESIIIDEPIEPKNYTFAEQITMLTKVLYEKRGNIELDPILFQQMIERANPHLKGLFDSLVKALIPNNRSEYNKIEARKMIVSLCYIMAGMRNKFVNDFKLEIGLYLSASGATRIAIDTMNSIGFSACYLTVNNFKRKLANEHPLKIRKFLSEENDHLYIYNLDDYHDIHEKRRPNTVTLSTVKHMATCICKQVSACASIPIVFNNTSVHNPKNIDASNICFRLINEYHGIFDIAYNNRKKQWLTHGRLDNDTFDQIELLTVHCYDDAIAERKEERSMKGVRLIGLQESNLHSMNDYIRALKMILDIDKDTEHLRNKVAPLVADWPGQLFIRKAITNLHKADSQYSIPAEINSFIPILGPLHVSLNSREHVLIIYYTFFQKLFHTVFGKKKVLAKKPKPWRINLLLDLTYNGWYERNHCELKDTFEKTKAYPYKPSSLKLLTDKTALFLLDYFQEIFKNQGKSKSIKLKKKKTLQYELFTLRETVDPKCLPTGYSANIPPSPDACDHCRKKLDDGEVLICGHGYHFECYQMMEYGCRHCEEYYKRGIYSNVNSFLERLERGPNVLTSEEKDEEVPVEENETVEEIETNKSHEIHTKFLNALNSVNTW